jgi:hypothetical protein
LQDIPYYDTIKENKTNYDKTEGGFKMARTATMIMDMEKSRQNLIDVVCDSTAIPSVTLHTINAIIETTIFIENLKKEIENA